MAYDFLSLVNEVNRRLNEVELTSSNFATATGFYGAAKSAVNASITHINSEEFNWPWNHILETDTLIAGTSRYALPANSKTEDWNSFRIKRDNGTGDPALMLKHITYQEYLDKHIDDEYNTDASIRSKPQFVARTASDEFVVWPKPDSSYNIEYEYYSYGFQLELHSDVPGIPSQYRHVIADGAMYYAYQFRSDTANANLSLNLFQDGIKYMRTMHINNTPYLRDTRVHF